MSTPRLMLILFLLGALTAPAHALTDAEFLALEISGDLLPPPAMVAQIEQDLASIRAINPYLARIHVMPSWVPGELLIKLTEDAFAEYEAGEYHDLDALNATYEATTFRSFFSTWFHVEFAHPYNPLRLGPEYLAVASVLYAEPNGLVGDGDDIRATEVGRYTFRHGWGDCPAGCIKEHLWVYTVNGGLVELVDESGDEFSTPSGTSSWGALKSHFRSQD